MRRFALFVILSLALPARAAIVHLKGGARIEGTVVSATARDVLVHTSMGPRKIDASEIVSIDYAGQSPPPPAPAAAAPVPVPPETQVLRNIERSRRQQLAFTLGITAPLNDVDFRSIGGGDANNGDVGGHVGLRYLYRISEPVDLGVDFDYHHRGYTSSFGLLPSAEASVGGDTLLFMGLARWMPRRDRRVRPYLLGGGGLHQTSTIIDAVPQVGFAWSDTGTAEVRRLVDDSAWGMAMTGRAGVEMDVSDPAVFSFEVGWLGLDSQSYDATSSGRDLGLAGVKAPVHALVLSARYGLRF
jgi:hypothetical protein